MSTISPDTDVHIAPGTTTFPLSSTQQMVWLDQTLNGNGTDYNIGTVLTFNHLLDTARFLRAFAHVVKRHDAMRLQLEHARTAPQQFAVEGRTIPVTAHDLSSHAEADTQARALIHQYLTDAFDLNGPLWRSALIQASPTRGYWVLASHHLGSDGMSLSVLINDLVEAYRHGVTDETDAEPAPSYFEFVEEDRAYFDTRHHARDLAFWTERYQTLPPALLTPRQSRADDTPSLTWTLDAPLAQAIEAVVAPLNLSLQHFIHAVMACYFARMTDTDDIVIGVPVHNRRGARQRKTLGMFASVIPVRITVSPDDTFTDILQTSAAELRRGYRHQRLPVAEINRHTQVQQQTGRPQLFDVVALFSPHALDLDVGQPAFEHIDDYQGPLLPLTVLLSRFVLQSDAKDTTYTTLRLSAGRDYFDAEDTQRLLARLQVMMSAIVQCPDSPLWQLPLMPDSERHHLLETLGRTPCDRPLDMTLPQAFELQVARTPDAIAIQHDGQAITYATLNRRANRVAHRLMALGVQPDDCVAMYLPRGPELLVAMLGTLKAGGAYLNLDLAYPEGRLRYMVDDAAPAVIISHTAHRQALSFERPTLMMDDLASRTDLPDSNPHCPALTPHHLALVIYTSGSTGRPKGVTLEHRNVRALAEYNGCASFTADDCVGCCANTAFDALTWEVWPTLLRGARLQLIPQPVLLSADRLRQALVEGGVTAMLMTTGLFHEYAEALAPVLPQLRYLFVGGDVLDPRKVATLQQANALPQHLVNAYGPTETTTLASIHEVDHTVDPQRPLPIGRPLGNARLYVLDRHQQPVPLGAQGELYIAGPGVARGYLNRPELTAERFLPDPFDDDADVRMYRTGDLVRWGDDGRLHYLGRNDHQIKLRGFRIELGEIEARLAQHPDVREALVIMREDTPGARQLVAYLLSTAGQTLSPATLREHISAQLASYMVPSAFVTVPHFPLTPNGKLDRRALPAPDARALAVREYEAPHTDTEQLLATLWQTLLGVDRVGRHDHFFELGGHSLSVMQLITRIQDTFYIALDVAVLFQTPVLLHQAALIEKHQAEAVGDQQEREMAALFDSMTAEELEQYLQAEEEA